MGTVPKKVKKNHCHSAILISNFHVLYSSSNIEQKTIIDDDDVTVSSKKSGLKTRSLGLNTLGTT